MDIRITRHHQVFMRARAARLGAVGALCCAFMAVPAAAAPPAAPPPAAAGPAAPPPATPEAARPAAPSSYAAAAPAGPEAAPAPAAAPGPSPAPPAASPASAAAFQGRADVLPYREDQPVPPGYRKEERMRTGLVVAGAVVMGVPYVIGLSAVTSSTSRNGAAWLIVPGIGPWLSLGARRSACSSPSTNSAVDNSFDCLGDALASTGLIFDGIIQTAGATLLIVGIASPKKVLVRDDTVSVTPAHVGSGYGVLAQGRF